MFNKLKLLLALFSVIFLGSITAKRVDRNYENFSSSILQRKGRIVGGSNAAPGSAPYQVSIQTIFGSHICGGVILDRNHFLTAAHCLEDFPLEILRVIVGTNKWQERADNSTYLIRSAAVHCRQDLPFYHNDIGIARVLRPFELSELVQPIELAAEYPPTGEVVTLTGWGSTVFNGPPPNDLQKLELNIISREECLNAWDHDEGVGIGHICTFTRHGEGACNGDSGGPIVYNGQLIGLVNWGAPCALGKPDMHASVVYYRDFIELAKSGCTRFRNAGKLTDDHK